MPLWQWTPTEVPGGCIFTNDVAEEYEIHQRDNKFYVARLVAECQDIGPLGSFNDAEAVVIKLGTMMLEFEEQAWCIVAAQALQSAGLLSLQAIEGAGAL
jgi:hypothetical protein